jgi:hypothetical protein
MRKDASQLLLVEIADIRKLNALLGADEVGQAFGKVARRHDEVGDAGGDGATRHRSVLGLLRILHQDDAAGFFDRAGADRAVRTGAAQDDGKPVAKLLRERTEEQVDRGPMAARLVEPERGNFVVDQLQPPVGRNDVDVVRLQAHMLADLHHRHFGARGEDRRHLAAVLRIEVHHDHEGGAGVVGKRREEGLHGVDAAGRRSDRHDHGQALSYPGAPAGAAVFAWGRGFGPPCVTLVFVIVRQDATPANVARPSIGVNTRLSQRVS